MDQISNPSIGTLMETLLQQMQESGYAESSLETTMRLARHISSFMEKHSISAGSKIQMKKANPKSPSPWHREPPFLCSCSSRSHIAF